jgi:glycosyltransferase involved in cell wall biosynthesis
VRIARELTDIHFDILGPVYDDAFSQQVLADIHGLPNIAYHGSLSRDQLAPYLSSARLFCSTSDYDGFPNTFLEAWSYGVPIVSSFDPDDTIQKHALGLTATGIQEFCTAIMKLVRDDDFYSRTSENARSYYNSFHRVDNVLPKFENRFIAVAMKDAVHEEN